MKIESIVNEVHTRSCTAAAPRIGANWKAPAPARERPGRPTKTLPRKGAVIAAGAVIMWFAMFPEFMAASRCSDADAAQQAVQHPEHQPARSSSRQAADQSAKPKSAAKMDQSLCRV